MDRFEQNRADTINDVYYALKEAQYNFESAKSALGNMKKLYVETLKDPEKYGKRIAGLFDLRMTPDIDEFDERARHKLINAFAGNLLYMRESQPEETKEDENE